MKQRTHFYRRIAAGVLSAVLASTVLVPGRAHAVDAESITISPVGIRQSLALGEAKQGTLTVVNDGNTSYDFTVYAAPYSVSNGTYTPDYTRIRANTDAYKWVQFERVKWRLSPGERAEVPYTLRVPYDVAPGGHYGVIFAETQPVKADATQVLRKKRVGAILYVTTPGKVTRSGSVLSSEIRGFQTAPPLRASLSVDNTGNTDYVMSKTFTVRSIIGRTKYRDKKEHTILPDTQRTLPMEWQAAPWVGLYRVSVETDILGKTSRNEKLVLIMPVWLIAGLLAVIGGSAYVKLRARRPRPNRPAHRS